MFGHIFPKCLITLMVLSCTSAFSWKSCNKNSKVIISELSVSPSPIEMPGTVEWRLDGELLEEIPSTGMSLQLTRKTPLFDFKIPCIKQIGSCSYKRLCTFAQDMIKENWGFIGAKIGPQLIAYRKKVYAEQGRVYDENSSTCEPVKPGPISLSSQVEVPKLPKLLNFLVAGDYSGRVELTDNSDGQTIVCVEFEFSSKDVSNNGLFGK